MGSDEDQGWHEVGGHWHHPHEVLLDDEFKVAFQGTKSLFRVSLTPKELVLSRKPTGCFFNKNNSIVFSGVDVVAVRLALQEKRPTKRKCPVFMVALYPRRNHKRIRIRLFFYMKKNSGRDEVAECGRLWVHAISSVFLGGSPEMLGSKSGPLLVLVNPKSGRGQSDQIANKVKGVLEEAGITYEMITTESQGHAGSIVQELDLVLWSGVLVVSGDGLVHEVYNGLFNRIDWMSSLQFPVGVVPAGSGNALSASILKYQGEDWEEEDRGVLSQAVSVARGNLLPLDLMLIKTMKETKIGFLSVGWGLLTDVDIDSEGLRALGSVRFFLHFLLKTLRHRVYQGTISYIPAEWPKHHTVQVPLRGDSDSDWTSGSTNDESTSGASDQKKSRQYSARKKSYEPNTRNHHMDKVHSESGQTRNTTTTDSKHHHQYHQHQYPGNYARHQDILASQLGAEVRGQFRNGGHHYQPLGQPDLSTSYAESWQELEHRLGMASLMEPKWTLDESNNNNTRFKVSGANNSYGPGAPFNHRGGSESPTDQQPSMDHLPSSPTSPTPTGLPPAAPSPIFPKKREAGGLLDPTTHPLMATPLHKDWVTESSSYLCVYVLNLPYIDRQTCLAPHAAPDDGIMWLLILRGSCSRTDLIRILLELDQNKEIHVPGFDLLPVTAVKLQPDSTSYNGAFMSVDGEKLPLGPVQVQALPQAGRVFVK